MSWKKCTVGIPGSALIRCIIRLRFTGFLARPQGHHGPFTFTAVRFSQLEGSDQERGAWDGWWPDLDETLDLDVMIAANTPFTVSYWLAITSTDTSIAWSHIDGQLLFLGLPQKARLTSCGGFSQGPVSIEDTAWGAVKSIYK